MPSPSSSNPPPNGLSPWPTGLDVDAVVSIAPSDGQYGGGTLPLDGVDFLTLHTGGKFPVPVDCLLIFATNIEPRTLAEEAFLRRIHYKIHIPSPTPDQYVGIFEAVCKARGLPFKGEAVGYVYQEYYGRRGIPARGCHPRDLVDHLFDIAKFLERDAELNLDLVDRACRSYFLDPSDDSIHLQT